MAMKWNYQTVLMFGWFSIGLSGIDTIVFEIKRVSVDQPYSFGLGQANTAMALVGALAVLVSKCLKDLEDKIETPPTEKQKNLDRSQ